MAEIKNSAVEEIEHEGRSESGREPITGVFYYAADSLSRTETTAEKAPVEMSLEPKRNVLSIEQLHEIPGIGEILEKFKQFHYASKELVKKQAGKGQPQPLMYDDRREPSRVRDFVLQFYNGDINQTFQEGLKYYYANKIVPEVDRRRIEELIVTVAYNPLAEELKRGEPEAFEPKRELEISLQEQYEVGVAIMEKLGLIEMLASGEMGIRGIDGKEYPLPTQEDIAKKMEVKKELVERKRAQGFTKILLVPFGMKLNDLIKAYEKSILNHQLEGSLFSSKKDSGDENEQLIPLALNKNQPLCSWDGYNDADITGELMYHPKDFSETHRALTKKEILGSRGGWRIILIEDMPDIPRGNPETKAGRVQLDTQGSSIKKYIWPGENIPSPREYLKALTMDLAYKGEEGMTPEDQLMYAITHLEETDQVIDDYEGSGSVSTQIGAYFPASGDVPRAFWDRERRHAYLGKIGSSYSFDNCGVRSAVRL